MIALVLVSHSPAIAEGVRDLVTQLSASNLLVVTAGGTDDGRLGTSADRVKRAITEAAEADGVVVIPDLGSAVLTVRSVLEEFPPGTAVLVDAPFLEGSVAAAVTASTGASADEVALAAREARHAAKF